MKRFSQPLFVAILVMPTLGLAQADVAGDLTNGIYSYALVVNGHVMDTKQMVKTK